MNMPKTIETYCKKCNSHTTHGLKFFKTAKPRTMSWGVRQNLRKHKMGYGGKAEFTAHVKKQNKKPVFLAECKVCTAKRYFVIPKRMKRVTMEAA